MKWLQDKEVKRQEELKKIKSAEKEANKLKREEAIEKQAERDGKFNSFLKNYFL